MNKNFLKSFTVIALVLVSVMFSGCKAKLERTIAYPWPVNLAIIYKLNESTIPANAMTNLTEYLDIITGGYEMECNVSQDEEYLQIEFNFNQYAVEDTENNYKNYKEFLRFFGMPSEKANTLVVDYWEEEKLFYSHRQFKFQNPWTVIMNDDTAAGKVTEINDAVRVRGFILALGETPQYFYAFNTSFRRTKVTGAYKHENKVTQHNYYFYGTGGLRNDEITVYDKFANQPAWYVSALIATAMFMASAYFVLKFLDSRKKLAENNQPAIQ